MFLKQCLHIRRCSILDCTCPCMRAIDPPSRAGYRSILLLTTLANSHTGQSGRRVPTAPVRTPEWSSRLSGQRRFLFPQPPGTSEYGHPLLISFRMLYFPASFICLWPSCHFDLGGLRNGWGCS